MRISTLQRSVTIPLLGIMMLTVGAASAVTLVENGQPKATIVVAAQTDAKVQAAAEEH